MNKLDLSVLKAHFPSINKPSNKRYTKDDIMKVLNFMKDHPNVQVTIISEYSKISLGTLVAWRKKYGKYCGIKVKGYTSNIEDQIDFNSSGADKEAANENNSGNFKVKIPLSMIQELRKLHDKGSAVEMVLNNLIYKVDNLNLYIYQKGQQQ